MSHGANPLKSIFFALAANSSITVAKAVAAYITGSGAMLAESIHSLADCGNQLLLLLGLKQAKSPPNPDYPLGSGKAVYFWSFVVAIMLFSLGGLFSIYEGVHKLQAPEALSYPWVAVGVLVFAIVAEGLSTWGCIREIGKVKGQRSLWQWFRQSRQSELIVILGEDLAALFGLCFALCAILLAMITGNPLWDAIGTIGIGVLLVIIAVLIGVEIKALLIGQGVEPEKLSKMKTFINGQPEVAHVFNVVTLQMGNDVMVAVKAQMVACTTGADMVEAINKVERAFKDAFPDVLWLFFEPDLAD